MRAGRPEGGGSSAHPHRPGGAGPAAGWTMALSRHSRTFLTGSPRNIRTKFHSGLRSHWRGLQGRFMPKPARSTPSQHRPAVVRAGGLGSSRGPPASASTPVAQTHWRSSGAAARGSRQPQDRPVGGGTGDQVTVGGRGRPVRPLPPGLHQRPARLGSAPVRHEPEPCGRFLHQRHRLWLNEEC